MAWFDETCINSDNIDMNDCRRINCVAPLHCTCMEGTVIDMIGRCNLNHLKMNHKTSPLGFLGFMYLLFWPSKHISLNVPSALLKSLHKATIFNIFTFYIGSFYIGKGEKENPPPALWRFYGPQLYCSSSLSRLSSVIFRYSGGDGQSIHTVSVHCVREYHVTDDVLQTSLLLYYATCT